MASKSIDEILADVSATKVRLQEREAQKARGTRIVDKELKELNEDLESLSLRSKLGKSRSPRSSR
jgi:hypothetical protein